MSAPMTAEALIARPGGGIEIVSQVLAEPTADQAVVQIAYGGICGSDLHYWRHGAVGESVIREPLVLGHEVVGTVVLPAKDGTSPAAGVPVVVHPGTEGTGDGSPYPLDRPHLAPGATYLGSAARVPHTDGAFATVVVLPARMLRTIPPGVGLRSAVIAEPAAVALHAVRRAGDLRGRSVVVIGCGPIGSLVAATARRAGAGTITAVDLSERAVCVARAVGADYGLVAPRRETVAGLHGEVVFESSGSVAGLSTAIRSVGRGGKVVMVGLPPAGPQPVEIASAISREIELIGSFRFHDELDEVLTALADGSLAVDALLSHEFALDSAEEAFSVAADASVSTKVVLRF